MRYFVDFGSMNTGGSPAFTVFKRTDTLADVTPPAVTEAAAGVYYFDYVWGTSPVFSSITYKLVLSGIELTDVISAPDTSVYPVTTSYTTAGDVINRAAVQLGLASVADPYTSTDPNFIQLREFLNTLGMDLLRMNEWSHLRREYTFATVLGQTKYALPADFRAMLDQTGWNRGTRLPLGGPLSGQQWQFLKARQVGIVFNTLFRLNPAEIELYSQTVPVGLTIAFEYSSNAWVQDGADPAVLKTSASATADKPMFDALLLIRGLKLLWLQAKGFDTALASREFQLTLDHEIGRVDGAPTINLNRRPMTGDRLLDLPNVPITGYGVAA